MKFQNITDHSAIPFTLPSRKIPAYRHTDLAKLFGADTEFFLEIDTKNIDEKIPESLWEIAKNISNSAYPLASFARDFPTQSNAKNTWENKILGWDIPAGTHQKLSFHAKKSPAILNELCVIRLGRNAKLSVEISGDSDIQLFQHIELWQDENSSADFFYDAPNAAFGRYDVHVLLRGEYAKCRIFGATHTRGKSHIDHHLWVEHFADYSVSEQFFKGIIEDQSHAVFQEKATVHPRVKHASVKQHNFNLLLSASAHIDTEPELEIFTDVVQAAHGATVGKLDELALFYVMSRGIPEVDARKILMDGFLNEVRERFGQ